MLAVLPRTLVLAAAAVALPAIAHAQPITQPSAVPELAQLRDDQQLADALSAIIQDPAIHVDDAKSRPLAQALMTEGVHQLQARTYDQALANFLEAYNKLPSPKILLNVASTLRDMGRPADAANTYQRYLADPTTGAERVAEVKELLVKLDEQLTILTVRVFPRGSEISIDAGPFVAVGSSLLTRVRPGPHTVRIRKGDASSELGVTGFEGETKEVSAALKLDVPPDKVPPPPDKVAPRPDKTPPPPDKAPPPDKHPTTLGDKLPIETDLPDKVDGWLIAGTQYSADNGNGRERRVRTGYTGPEVAPIVPPYETTDTGEVIVHYPSTDHIGSGVLAVVRIDGKLRGFAGGLGLAFAVRDELELEVAGLRSDVWGVYLGARYRFSTTWFRPYVGAGLPIFLYTDATTMDARIAPGLRAAGGLELKINGHMSVQGDLGIEHFFNVSGTPYDATVFVPTIGVIGRM